jgi:hypothetical protein
MWNIRGWNRLTVHDDPPLVAARQEFQSWLTEVPEPWQSKWRGRLESALDHLHLSVRFELYLHHYFKSEGWAVHIEPEMPGSLNKPDFRVMRGTDTILVEAKAILDEQTITQETGRLRQVADNLSGKLSRDVIIEPLSDLPPSLPAGRIKAQIEQRVKTQADEVVEFNFADVHQGSPFTLKIVILPGGSSTKRGGVGGTISGVHTLNIGKRIRDALKEKAGKYSSIDMPFVIAVYGAGEFPVQTEHEFDALCGDREWLVPTKGMGKTTERRKPNGFFTSVREGKRRHEDVSAALFYRFKWLEHTHVHLLHIYHNPFALRPVNPDLFPGVPQMVPDNAGSLKWINGGPD